MKRILFRDVEVIATFDPQGAGAQKGLAFGGGSRIAALAKASRLRALTTK